MGNSGFAGDSSPGMGGAVNRRATNRPIAAARRRAAPNLSAAQ